MCSNPSRLSLLPFLQGSCSLQLQQGPGPPVGSDSTAACTRPAWPDESTTSTTCQDHIPSVPSVPSNISVQNHQTKLAAAAVMTSAGLRPKAAEAAAAAEPAHRGQSSNCPHSPHPNTQAAAKQQQKRAAQQHVQNNCAAPQRQSDSPHAAASEAAPCKRSCGPGGELAFLLLPLLPLLPPLAAAVPCDKCGG